MDIPCGMMWEREGKQEHSLNKDECPNQSSHILWALMPSNVNDMMSESGGTVGTAANFRPELFPTVTAREHKTDDTGKAKSIV